MATENPSKGNDASASKGLVERLLSPIADVRRGEATNVLLMASVMFLTLGAYYMLKTAREVFILSQGGAEVKSEITANEVMLSLNETLPGLAGQLKKWIRRFK